MDKNLESCPLCLKTYQMGPHRYEGIKIQKYDLFVCQSCFDSNWDGWSPHSESKVLEHLKNKGIPIPERNAKGWLPRGD